MNLRTAFFRLTYATAFWAFVTLLSTGEVHLVAAAIFLAVFGLAAWKPGIGRELPPAVWTAISLLAFCAAVWGWMVLSQRMYSATYFFFYLELNKLLTARANRDYLQIYALTFFHILAASVSTESVLFAPMLAVYLLLIIASMMIFTIKRDAEHTYRRAKRHRTLRRHPPEMVPPPRRVVRRDRAALLAVGEYPLVTRRTALSVTVLTLAVIVLGSGIFWLIPRSARQSFFSPFGPDSSARRTSGFADNISFGGVGEIQSDPAIIMRAAPVDLAGPPPQFLRIRGTSLDYFTGREWRKDPQEYLQRPVDTVTSRIDFEIPQREGVSQEWRVTLEPESSRYLFLPDRPLRVNLGSDMRVDIDELNRSVRRRMPRYGPVTYDVTNWVGERRFGMAPEMFSPAAREGLADSLMQLARDLPEDTQGLFDAGGRTRSGRENLDVNLQLPQYEGSDAVVELARQWTAGLTDDAAIAAEIERRFKEFGYSLENDFSSREDHIRYFLTEAREGHCEYFATAMVLMLRHLEIPARIVNGYLTDEWVNTGSRFIVRQEHAHSWVEARIDGNGGWVTFDPTPADGIGRNRIAISLYHRFSQFFDMIKMAWYSSVIDYGLDDQRSTLIAIFSTIRQFQTQMNTGLELFGETVSGQGTVRGNAVALAQLMMMAFFAVVLAAGLILFLRRRQALASGRRGSADARHTDRADIRPFLELLEDLQQIFPRRPGQTPLAWAEGVRAETGEALDDLPALTREYNEARFRNQPWTTDLATRAEALRGAARTWQAEHHTARDLVEERETAGV